MFLMKNVTIFASDRHSGDAQSQRLHSKNFAIAVSVPAFPRIYQLQIPEGMDADRPPYGNRVV